MRVLHVLHTSLPYICGYSIRSDYILENQSAQGLAVGVVTSAQHPNSGPPYEERCGIPYWRTTVQDGHTAPVVRELRLMRALEVRLDGVIRTWQPHILHAHSPMLVGLPAVRSARRAGLPVVYEVRDLWENASVDRGKFSEASPAYRAARAIETRVLRRADAVVTICENLRREISPRAGSPEKTHVVANGVDTDTFRPSDRCDDARARWGVGSKHIIGYIGTFQPYEGLDVLIRALPNIIRRTPAAHLMIVGSGGLEPQLKALVHELRLDDRVTFTGRVPHSEVGDIYAICDILVYPRLLTRTTALTTPLKPLEAMAMGKAIIVSDVPAMRELVDEGTTGLTFHAGDFCHLTSRCVDLLGDAALRERIGNAARSWVLARRQWPALVASYRAIYDRVLP